MNQDNILDIKHILILGAYINQSKYRKKVMEYLKDNRVGTPTEISTGTDIRVNHISKVLKELKDKEVIKCLNEDMRKGRLYYLTPLGEEVLTTSI